VSLSQLLSTIVWQPAWWRLASFFGVERYVTMCRLLRSVLEVRAWPLHPLSRVVRHREVLVEVCTRFVWVRMARASRQCQS
jgi:hypothetical protein